jgi:N-acetylglucosamine kinase-like BadF-type ATPase
MLEEVSAAANIPLMQITRTCMGLAGVTIPAVRAWATRALSTQLSGECLLLGDEEIALEAAFPGGPGVLLIAGTGSHAIARGPDGSLHRAGGWGPILGDEGGGYWVGLEALRAALRTHNSSSDGSSASILLQAIQDHWKLRSLPEFIEVCNRRGDATRPAADFASLAPVVARCAVAGSALAIDVLHRAGEMLADLVTVVAGKVINIPSATAQSVWMDATIPVAFTGSVLEHIPAVRHALAAALSRTLPAAQLGEAAIDPLDGALHRARNG